MPSAPGLVSSQSPLLQVADCVSSQSPLLQVANLQGQHLPRPVHHQQAQQQQGAPGLHRQMPPQLVQQQRGGGLHTMRSPTQDAKSHMTLQQVGLPLALPSGRHVNLRQMLPN